MRSVVVINYYLFWEKNFPVKKKHELNHSFKCLILFVFTTVAPSLKSTKRKGKISLETKNNTIQTNQSLTFFFFIK